MKIADYFSPTNHKSKNENYFDEAQSFTSNLLSKNQEHIQSNSSFFNEGKDLNLSLVNVSKAYDLCK